ncbi:MAG: hypothetical protein QOJ46_1281, partial [bacterium]
MTATVRRTSCDGAWLLPAVVVTLVAA